MAVWLLPTFFSRSSFSFVQEASYWLFSAVATFSLLFRDSIRAFLLVASSVNVFTYSEVEQQDNRIVKKKKNKMPSQS